MEPPLDPPEGEHHPDCPCVKDENAKCRCRWLDYADACDRADARKQG